MRECGSGLLTYERRIGADAPERLGAMSVRVEISEQSEGWYVEETGIAVGEFYPTAAAAQHAVLARATARAETSGKPDVTVIEWETTTRIGTLVVAAIAGVSR
jgi:hypothetical protein